MSAAAEDLEVDDGLRLWAAGEAAAMQRIRKLAAGPLGLSRTQTVIRGYWKVARPPT